jgi:hypothetical protein
LNIITSSLKSYLNLSIGYSENTDRKGRVSTVDLLIRVACFVKKVDKIFNVKRSLSKLFSTRRSTVLSLPLHLVFPGLVFNFHLTVALAL